MKKEISGGLNQYLANVSVMYIKLHNLHWNVVGLQFKQVHEYLEELYDNMAEVLDEVAELLKIHSEMPLASMKDYLAVAEISELESKEVANAEAIAIASQDMLKLKENAEKVRRLADEDGQYDVVSMLEDHLTNYNKYIWFLSTMAK